MDYIEYRKMATELVEKVSDLQKKVLIKHTTAILQELHEHVKDQETRIQGLVEALEEIDSEADTSGDLSHICAVARKALTAYKEGKHNGD